MAVIMWVDRTTVARVYKDVKGRILGGGLRLRERLDVEELAKSHKVSATPVRQALALLASERLVVSHPTRGYHVTLWSEDALRDLYEWRGMLACLAAKTYEPVESMTKLNGVSLYADAVTCLLQRLNAAANVELARAATNADERLRAARFVEPELISTCEVELEALAGEMRDGTPEKVQAALRDYHQRRTERATEIRAHAVLRALPEDSE